MKTQRVIAAIVGLALPLLAGQAQAAEIKVLASTAVKTILEELGPQFEKATGNKVDFAFAPAAVLKEKIDQGAAFDVAILTAPVTDSLAGKGRSIRRAPPSRIRGSALRFTRAPRSPISARRRPSNGRSSMPNLSALRRQVLPAPISKPCSRNSVLPTS